jgi:predicted GIY-YIG superfamily endonuclease
MKKYYVYELINLYGTVEYVGETLTPKGRMYSHTRKKPTDGNGNGKFYGRQDLVMNIVDTFDTRKDARRLETELKLSYGLEPTERQRSKNNAIKGAYKLSKPLLVFKLDGTFVEEFPSAEECCKKLNLSTGVVSMVRNGQRKQTKGYIIKKKENV